MTLNNLKMRIFLLFVGSCFLQVSSTIFGSLFSTDPLCQTLVGQAVLHPFTGICVFIQYAAIIPAHSPFQCGVIGLTKGCKCLVQKGDTLLLTTETFRAIQVTAESYGQYVENAYGIVVIPPDSQLLVQYYANNSKAIIKAVYLEMNEHYEVVYICRDTPGLDYDKNVTSAVIFTRDQHPPRKYTEAAFDVLKRNGIDPAGLVKVDHEDCPEIPEGFCTQQHN